MNATPEQVAEHDAMGAEHAAWCGGPSAHRKPDGYQPREDASYYDTLTAARWAVRNYPHSGFHGTTPRLIESGPMAGKYEVIWTTNPATGSRES
jgi:hypothetical protein